MLQLERRNSTGSAGGTPSLDLDELLRAWPFKLGMIDDDARRRCAQTDFNHALGNRNNVLDTLYQIVSDKEAFGHVGTDRSIQVELRRWKAQLIELLDGSELPHANPLFYYHSDNIRDKLEGMRKDANEGKIHALVGSTGGARSILSGNRLKSFEVSIPGPYETRWKTVKSDLRLIESKVFTSKVSRFRNQWSATILGEIRRREDFSVSRFACWYTIKPVLGLMLTKINSIKAEVREGNLSQKKMKAAFLAEFDTMKMLRLIGLGSVARSLDHRRLSSRQVERVYGLTGLGPAAEGGEYF
ncbi:hypothetical protein JCM3766R1_000106 [Sporobolomyces carnicolor]